MGQTILLADDSITIQKVIELTFADEDFELHTVGNGQKAIEEVRSVRPDIVLCDIIMPEKNGYEVCEFIKTNDDLKHIPVLLLTGAFEPFDQERARKAGCDGFLAKPFEPQTLISKVRDLLASAKPAAAASPKGSGAPSAPPSRPTPPAGESSDATVMMGSPVPPMSEPSEEEASFNEGFVEEAGERELSVQSGDQSALLGEESASNDDIWSEMQQEVSPSTPGSVEHAAEGPGSAEPDEGATIMMGTPPTPIVEPVSADEAPGGGGFDQFATVEPEETAAGDDAWVIDTTEDLGEEPELTPLGDFGGFEDLSRTDEKLGDASAAEEKREVGTETYSGPAGPPPLPKAPPEAPPSVPRATEPPVSAEPPAPPAPPRPAPPAQPPSAPAASASPPSAPAPPRAATDDAVEAPKKKKAPVSAGASSPAKPEKVEAAEIDAVVDRVVERVLAKLSEKVVQEVAWEVVPDLAQTLIQREIDALKAKIPK